MREMEIHDYARQLLEAHGPKAIAEAAQNAIDLESKGELELARTWRHIEDAMKAYARASPKLKRPAPWPPDSSAAKPD
ncbi:hypothetical protein [Bradyrhizobium sp. CCGUVB1N3]|uniref:hypothetical protein n=1 Tax=Bradyrhizobium sp. CCGUVB1N3 TaxID=2949629 RepID=UPI003531EFD5